MFLFYSTIRQERHADNSIYRTQDKHQEAWAKYHSHVTEEVPIYNFLIINKTFKYIKKHIYVPFKEIFQCQLHIDLTITHLSFDR